MEYALHIADRVRRMFQAFLGLDVNSEEFRLFLEEALLGQGMDKPRSMEYRRLHQAVKKAISDFLAQKGS